MPLTITCQCKKLRLEVSTPAGLYNNHFVCMCDDCQAYAHHIGAAGEVLDENGGTDVVPVFPARLKIVEGANHLKCVRLTEKGIYRWYAGCCQTPIANSLPAKMGYIGLITNSFSKEDYKKYLGPTKAMVFAQFGKLPLPKGSHRRTAPVLIFTAIRKILEMLVRGLRKPNPFFDAATDAPVVEPHVLTAEERSRAYAVMAADHSRSAQH